MDAGAVFCKTRDDLGRYQARLAGQQSAGPNQRPDCRFIQDRTGIKILDHNGPAQTEVALSGADGEIGWTDAYLPTTPPSAVTTSVQNH